MDNIPSPANNIEFIYTIIGDPKYVYLDDLLTFETDEETRDITTLESEKLGNLIQRLVEFWNGDTGIWGPPNTFEAESHNGLNTTQHLFFDIVFRVLFKFSIQKKTNKPIYDYDIDCKIRYKLDSFYQHHYEKYSLFMRKVFLDPRYYPYSTRRSIDHTFGRGLDLLYAFLIEANKIKRKKSRVLSVVILRIGAIIHFLHVNYDKTYETQERSHDVWDTKRKERLKELQESERIKREEEERRKEEAKRKTKTYKDK